MFNLLRFKKNRIISAYNNSNKIVANSSYTKDLMQVSLNINREKIKIIHPGIDIYKDFISDSDEERIKTENREKLTSRSVENEIQKLKKIIFEKEQINGLMRNEYSELTILHDSLFKRRRKRRPNQTSNFESSYNTFSDH